MIELYLEIYRDVDIDGVCDVPVETLIVLFLLVYCEHPPILITFVITDKHEKFVKFKVRVPNILFEVIEQSESVTLAKICKLPLIVTNDGTTCVGGLCSTLRQLLKFVDPLHKLLGFKQSCLYACAEVSIWTKFCEVDIINCVKNIVNIAPSNEVTVPEDVIRFENHMLQPVRTHNIQKQKQDLAKANGYKNSHLPDNRIDMVQDLNHTYAEGSEISLADLILFPCFHIILQTISSVFLKEHVPLIFTWYENLSKQKNIQKALKIVKMIDKKCSNEVYVKYNIPDIPSNSLYKSDPKRYKPRHRIYTRQEDIETCLNIVKEMNLNIEIDKCTFGNEVEFDWSTVPYHALPEAGQLPEKRLDKKSRQLENMAKAVLKIAKQGDVIVDFCSGSGHLGLILAHFLPRCTVILLENKEQSLTRARDRCNQLKLTNVIFCQSNLDYFIGKFNIGVSLHACGVATDLVIDCCIKQKASFVCCPCCYGSIQTNHIINYPQSNCFKSSALSNRDYLVICHAADQTHDVNNVKTNQGNICMDIVDIDRYLYVQQFGYRLSLSKLNPVSCTPKHNLIVGISPK